MYVIELETLYKSYALIFYRRSYFVDFIVLHRMPEPLYKRYGSKNSQGGIWGHWGQKVIFTKNATFSRDYMAWSYNSCI